MAVTWRHISNPESWQLPSPHLSPSCQVAAALCGSGGHLVRHISLGERDLSALTSLEHDVEWVSGKEILPIEVPSIKKKNGGLRKTCSFGPSTEHFREAAPKEAATEPISHSGYCCGGSLAGSWVPVRMPWLSSTGEGDTGANVSLSVLPPHSVLGERQWAVRGGAWAAGQEGSSRKSATQRKTGAERVRGQCFSAQRSQADTVTEETPEHLERGHAHSRRSIKACC